MAALYLEHGFEQIEPAIVAAFSEKIEYARSSHVDYKTELQEALARSGRQVHYTVLEVEGPPHDRRFVCAAHVAGVQLGVGRGSTKKAAEQEAARQALDALGVSRADQISQRVDPCGRMRGPSATGGIVRRRPTLRLAASVARMRGSVHLKSLKHPRLQILPRPARDRRSSRGRRRRRPERLRQVEHRRRGRLGGRLADSFRASRREARRRPLRRRRRPQGRRALRGRARVRQRGRTTGRSSTSARSRSPAGSFVAARGSTSSTRRRCAARISSSCSPTSGSGRRCTRSSARARSSRCSPRSRRTGGRSSRRRPGSESSSAEGTAPS